nr:hypothetical protein [Tanacetum cinerariifolium]
MRPFGCLVTILNTLDPLGSGPAWLFDIDSLSQTMNYHPVLAENQSNTHGGTQTYVLFLVLSDGFTIRQNNNKDALVDGKEHDDDIQNGAQTRNQGDKTENKDKDSTNDFSAPGPSNAAMPNLEDLSHNEEDVGAEADINNL